MGLPQWPSPALARRFPSVPSAFRGNSGSDPRLSAGPNLAAPSRFTRQGGERGPSNCPQIASRHGRRHPQARGPAKRQGLEKSTKTDLCGQTSWTGPWIEFIRDRSSSGSLSSGTIRFAGLYDSCVCPTIIARHQPVRKTIAARPLRAVISLDVN
jgi:hypothetical protein